VRPLLREPGDRLGQPAAVAADLDKARKKGKKPSKKPRRRSPEGGSPPDDYGVRLDK